MQKRSNLEILKGFSDVAEQLTNKDLTKKIENIFEQVERNLNV